MATPIPENTVAFTVDEIVTATSAKLRRKGATSIRGVVTDSRRVKSGNLFVAIRGEKLDGHAYLEEVLKAGASAVLVEKGAKVPKGPAVIEVEDTIRALGELAALHRKRFGGRVICVTGSAGKTTTKELIAASLRALGARVLASAGNLNNLVGAPMVLFGLSDSFDVAVLEIGTSHKGEIERLAQICAPYCGVVTLVDAAHTEGIGSVDDVEYEKGALFRALPADGLAIGNIDDARVVSQLEMSRATRRLGFGRGEAADVRLIGRHTDPIGLGAHNVYEVGPDRTRLEVSMRLIGEAAALDAGAALAVAYATGGKDALEEAALGIAKLSPTPGRFALVRTNLVSVLIDDSYNANPGSTLLSLRSLSEIASDVRGRAVAILGDMRELGELEGEAHRRVGDAIGGSNVSLFIAAGEAMARAAETALERSRAIAGRSPLEIVCVSNAEAAANAARGRVRDGDVVLVKGSRSMGMERVVEVLAAPEKGGRA